MGKMAVRGIGLRTTGLLALAAFAVGKAPGRSLAKSSVQYR
jgi:hypothetical protein